MRFCTQALVITSGQLAVLIVASVLLLSGALPLRADETTRCTVNGPSQTVCRIDQPVVSQRLTQYPQVTFQPGDTVSINAGGCVQTGGWGATWKRYVNPSGPDSNVKYWGTISIPGATEGVVRLSDMIGKTLTVAPGIAPPFVLSLGYVDSDYSDNGYSSHDDGTQNQCRNVGNAFVQLTIMHSQGTAASCAGSSGRSPLDVAWTSCDLNGFPMNPKWQYQVSNNGSIPPSPLTLCPQAVVPVGHTNPPQTGIDFPPSCISWPVTYDKGDWCGPHVNYFAVTYQGPVKWWQKSDVFTDDDYNYFMFPKNHEGEFGPSPDNVGVEIEFDSDETVDHFSGSSPLWGNFRDMVDHHNDAAQAAVNQKMAVVVSLLGLDCGHVSCGSEEHPVYAMAVDMDNSNLADDQWGVFARNWGNEGYCAGEEHNIPVNDLKVLVPWLLGASDVNVLPNTQFYPFSNSDSSATVGLPQISVVQGQGVLLDFTLPEPSAQMGLAGEVHLQWTFPAGRIPSNIVARSFAGRVANQARILGASRVMGSGLSPDNDEDKKPENVVSALLSQLPDSQLQGLRAQLATASGTATALAKLPMRPVVRLAVLPQRPGATRLIAPQSVPDARIANRNAFVRSALCQTYNNNVPGLPLACRTPIRLPPARSRL